MLDDLESEIMVHIEIAEHKFTATICELEELGYPIPQPLESLVTELCPQDEESEHELKADTPHHYPPSNLYERGG